MSERGSALDTWWDAGPCGFDSRQPLLRMRCRLPEDVRGRGRVRKPDRNSGQGVAARVGGRCRGAHQGSGGQRNIKGSCLLQEGTGYYSGKESRENQEKVLEPESPRDPGVGRNTGNCGGPALVKARWLRERPQKRSEKTQGSGGGPGSTELEKVTRGLWPVSHGHTEHCGVENELNSSEALRYSAKGETKATCPFPSLMCQENFKL